MCVSLNCTPKMFTEASIQIRLKECYLWPKTSSETILECIIWQFFMGSSMPQTPTRCVLRTHWVHALLMLSQHNLLSLDTPLRKLSERCQKWNSRELCAATGQSWTSFSSAQYIRSHETAITHANNWSLTIINFPIFTQGPANLMWPQIQLCLGVAIPLSFVKCIGL